MLRRVLLWLLLAFSAHGALSVQGEDASCTNRTLLTVFNLCGNVTHDEPVHGLLGPLPRVAELLEQLLPEPGPGQPPAEWFSMDRTQWDAHQTQLARGRNSTFDLITLDPALVPDLVASGALLDLEPFIATDAWGGTWPGLMAAVRWSLSRNTISTTNAYQAADAGGGLAGSGTSRGGGDSVYGIPLGTSIVALHYRRDVLAAHGLGVPATFVQTQGLAQGAFFDPASFQPLVQSPAMSAALRVLRRLYAFGPPRGLANTTDLAGSCSSLKGTAERLYAAGRCAFLIGPHPIHKDHLLHAPSDAVRQFGRVAHLPGSTQVWDRASGLLQSCTPALCPYAVATPAQPCDAPLAVGDTVFANVAPLMGLSPLAVGVDALTTHSMQAHTLGWLARITDPEVVWAFMLDPDVPLGPMAYEHVAPSSMRRWAGAGYPAAAIQDYLTLTSQALTHPNQLGFPAALQRFGAYRATLHAAAYNMSLYGNGAYGNGSSSNSASAAATGRTEADIMAAMADAFAAQFGPNIPGYSTLRLQYLDIEASTVLWEELDALVMDVALNLHHDTLRQAIAQHGGYESVTEGDSFTVQSDLMAQPWPPEVLQHDACRCDQTAAGMVSAGGVRGAAQPRAPSSALTATLGQLPQSAAAVGQLTALPEESPPHGGRTRPLSKLFASPTTYGAELKAKWVELPPGLRAESSRSAVLVFRGFRVRCGIHSGVEEEAEVNRSHPSGRTRYSGPTLLCAKAVSDAAHGGMVFASRHAVRRCDKDLLAGGGVVLWRLGDFLLGSPKLPATLYQLHSTALVLRAALQRPLTRTFMPLGLGLLDAPLVMVGVGLVRISSLWLLRGADPRVSLEAACVFQALCYQYARHHRGYLAQLGAGRAMAVFPNAYLAALWAAAVHAHMMRHAWSSRLLATPTCEPHCLPPSAAAGVVHWGASAAILNSLTGVLSYEGPVVDELMRLLGGLVPNTVVCTQEAAASLRRYYPPGPSARFLPAPQHPAPAPARGSGSGLGLTAQSPSQSQSLGQPGLRGSSGVASGGPDNVEEHGTGAGGMQVAAVDVGAVVAGEAATAQVSREGGTGSSQYGVSGLGKGRPRLQDLLAVSVYAGMGGDSGNGANRAAAGGGASVFGSFGEGAALATSSDQDPVAAAAASAGAHRQCWQRWDRAVAAGRDRRHANILELRAMLEELEAHAQVFDRDAFLF
eukprot:XP_001692904.1 predicted protein [Chlamydomonas reinhardtii]